MNPDQSQRQALWIMDIIALLACAAVTGVAYFCIVDPMLSKRATLARQREQLVSEQQKCSRLNAAVLAMRKQSDALEHELETSAVQLEFTDLINQKIAQLTALLGDCGLEMEDIQTQAIVSHRRSDLVPIRVSGLGGYPQATQFLNQLREILPDIAIHGFSLAGAPSVASHPGQFAFNLCWFAAPSLSKKSN